MKGFHKSLQFARKCDNIFEIDNIKNQYKLTGIKIYIMEIVRASDLFFVIDNYVISRIKGNHKPA